MRKHVLFIFTCLVVCQGLAAAIPSQITYQGTLKQNGVPTNVPKNMTFQLLSPDGRTPYSLIISSQVPVTNGLFSIALDFQLLPQYTWETINPYIQVSVEGQALTPNEPVTATVYAMVSNTVVDGSITPAKINATAFQAAGPGIVPVGMIAMFNTSCPAGWTRFSALDNTFPMGSSIYGVTGGSATHTHVIDPDGAHTHQTVGLPLTAAAIGNGPTCFQTATCPAWDPYYPGQTTTSAGMHDHGGATHPASSLPPYLGVIFCQKQ